MPNSVRYVVDGATVKCTQDSVSTKIIASSSSRIGNQLRIIETDTTPLSFEGNFGNCKILTARNRGKPTPCAMANLPVWFVTNMDFISGSELSCVTMDSFAVCTVGPGAITPEGPGQSFEDMDTLLLAEYAEKVMISLTGEMSSRPNWWSKEFPGLSSSELLQLCSDAKEFGMNNLIYKSLERTSINRAYVRTQPWMLDPDQLLTFTRADVLKDMATLDDEIRRIGRKILDKGKDLKIIPTEYFGDKLKGMNAPECVLLYEYGATKYALAGAQGKTGAVNYFYTGWLDGSAGNSYQHALWNAQMTVYYGDDKAKLFADAHEFGMDMSDIGYVMDLQNNKIGRQTALDNDYLRTNSEVIREKIKNEELVIHPFWETFIKEDGTLGWEKKAGETPAQKSNGNTMFSEHPELRNLPDNQKIIDSHKKY